MCVITSNIASLLPKPIDVNITSDMSCQQAALVHLHSNVLKKFHDDKMSKSARLAAVSKFLESNEICKSFEWNQESYYYDIVMRVKNRLYEIFHSGPMQENVLNMFDIVQNCMPGPGSSLSTKETSFYGKLFGSKLSTYDSTGSLYRYWSENLSYRWRAAEKARLSEYGLDFVSCSNMSFAHKNLDEARTINTEASLEMLLQKGAASIIEGLLMRFYNIDIRKQPKINRMLARLGSIDGSFATIDLKDGSNRISTEFYKLVLPPQVFSALDRIRAKCIGIPKSLSDLGELQVSMFSTQGNGFTFALQTLMFASITEATYESMGLATDCHAYPHFSVFGDDIICVKHAFYKLSKTLEFCGFTVNSLKSFNSGDFRESCGADFFKGQNIRSVYIKRIRHERHKYSVFNRLLVWSIRCGVDVSAVLLYIKGLVDFRPVPLDESDEAGLRLPYEFAASATESRKGVTDYYAWTPKPKFVATEERFERINSAGFLISAMHGSLVSRVDRRGKRSVNEPLGRIQSVRDGFLERQKPTRYVLRRKSTSSWDFCPKGLTTLDYMISLLPIL